MCASRSCRRPDRNSVSNEAAGISKLKQTLLAYKSHYTDPGYAISTVVFFENGTFHSRWHWHYWIAGPRAIHVQFWDADYKPATADTFTFNDDLTKFTCPNADGSPRIEGTRMELVTP